eukprot:8002516-Alexandrium_andersonii.AAC.1
MPCPRWAGHRGGWESRRCHARGGQAIWGAGNPEDAMPAVGRPSGGLGTPEMPCPRWAGHLG